ncbi:lipopolysaccharide biosynthesis protein [Starkeya koreensis]|uniref:Lipopolysaccharide biosynthesis protein n=1 Tax=Ancylobacter koreensis TaxID=266121 RepID=A0ABT0DGM4_9HYPH|nr:lipopolysaccharide biosynthesis protein [Ancylobacter koreensis]MCK0206427.1 lipopolysaccharide biosynthesis protein [Ancylobacter koreensis]
MLGHRVALGAALLTALQLLTRCIDMLALVVMARLLTPADFGLVALAASVLLIASAVTDIPVAHALVQRDSIEPQDIDTAFTLNLARGLAVMLIIGLAAGPMVGIYEDARLAPILYALSLVPLLTALASPALVHFQRRIEYGPTARSQLVGKFCGVLVALATALATHSYWALIVGQLASAFISTAVTYRYAPYRPRLRLGGAGDILKFTGWLTASRIISTLNLQSDRFFIGHMLGKSQLGQYTMGSDIASIATYTFANPIMQTMFGGFSRLQSEAGRLRAAYLKGQQVLVIFLLPLGVGLSVVADRLVPLVLGPNWDAAVTVIVWLGPVVALQVLYLPLMSLSMAMGRPGVVTLREAINLGCRLPATLAGAWYYGLLGAVVARSVGGAFIIFLTLTLARRFLHVSVLHQLANVGRSLASTLAMIAATLLAKHWLAPSDALAGEIANLLVFVLAGAGAYVATHVGLWLAAGRPEGAETFVISLARSRLGGR